MARLESQSKLLFYPTPNGIADTLATWFSAEKRVRIADPCCGTGEALMRFSAGLDAERLGVELSYSRAELATQVLDKVLPTSFYTATWSVQSVGLMFNNPPYDYSQFGETINGRNRSVRHEVLFIERTKEKIAIGGHNVIIVPRMILGDAHSLGAGQEARIARHLLGWYEDVQVFRFPDGEYERFKQVVVLACKRRAKYAIPTKEAIEAIVSLADENTDIQVLPEGDGRYVIPAACPQYVFRFNPQEPKDEVRAMRKCNPTATPEYIRATYIRPVGETFNPVESIKVGHVTLLISGNDVGAVKLTGENGESILVKGTSKKIVEQTVVTNIDDKGNEHDDVTAVDKYIPVWTVTHNDGQIETLTDVQKIAKLAERYARELADAVQVRNTPLYGNNPTPKEWAATAKIGVNMPALPGRTERGLFERQRHWAIALQRAMRSRKHAIANLGMGSGKTIVTIATLNTLNKFPAVVVVPAHMPAEWVKTAILGSDSTSPIKPMWITRPTREAHAIPIPTVKEIPGATLDFSKLLSPLFHTQYQPGWITEWNTNTTKWASLQKAIEDIGGEVVNTSRWHDEKDDTVRRWRKVEIRCEMTQAAQIATLVTHTLLVRMDGFTYRPEIKFTTGGLTFTYFDVDDYTLFDFEQDWNDGKLGSKAMAIVSIETAKYDSGDCEGFVLPRKNFISANNETGEIRAEKLTYCPQCGQPVRIGWRFCKNKIREQNLGDPILNDSGKVVSFNLEAQPQNDRDLPDCGAPLFQFSRYRRTGGARLLQHKLRGLFKVYVGDEIHKNKSLDSDSGYADQRLISATRYSLGLTGTLFGGTGSSIFPLLYRRVPDIRAQFAFDDVTRWVDIYGVWEKKWKENKASLTGRGANTGLSRWGYRSRELPGVSPAVIRYLLPLCVFGQVTDLGYELPPFLDEVESIPMSLEMEKQYQSGRSAILDEAMTLLKEDHDPGGLSTWFNFCRFRANSMFRPEEFAYRGKLGGGFGFSFKAINTDDRFLPKEDRLATIIAENARRGRKTLVFAEQTGSRDIRSRMKHAIEAKSSIGQPMNIEIMSAGDMAPVKRMAWIKANAPTMDALIVNPKLVETGLTLTMFSDIVFYEVTPSLYTLWQSMRRVWRLGQSKDVVTHFLAYEGTVEDDILSRMGKKMRYASMLYGDSAASVLESSDGDESIKDEIIRAALSGVLIDREPVKHLFSTGNEKVVAISTDITGSLVASTPNLPTVPSWDEWKKIKGAMLSNVRRKAKDTVPFSQLSIGF